jgi:hypothetical protein
VPPVTGLHRAGQRPADGLGVGTGPVPAHDLDAWVGAQPRLRDVGGPAGQDVDPATGLGVDQDRRVLPAPAQREIIDAQHPGHSDLGQRKPQQQPQRGMTRDRHAQAGQQTRPGSSR